MLLNKSSYEDRIDHDKDSLNSVVNMRYISCLIATCKTSVLTNVFGILYWKDNNDQ